MEDRGSLGRQPLNNMMSRLSNDSPVVPAAFGLGRNVRADSPTGLLEKLRNSDNKGYRGARLDCGHGHSAKFVGCRDKRILTVLADDGRAGGQASLRARSR